VIAKVKKAVKIPVIGNGDVTSRKEGFRMMEETGCDLVMIGRGALGNPWIFDASHEGAPSSEELREVMLRHLSDTAELKGEHIAVLEMRKHVGWYLKGRPGAASFRNEVNRIDDIGTLKNAISGIL
jgi:tRNA-dihydrouridine synthase B